MMNAFGSIMFWCALQVGLVALLGVVLSKLFSRQSSSGACSAVCAAALVCTLLTMLAPFPVHRWFSIQPAPKAVDAKIPQAKSQQDDLQNVAPAESNRSVANAPRFNLLELARSLGSFARRAQSVAVAQNRICGVLIAVLLAMIGLGCARLASGILFVQQLRRDSIPVSEPDLCGLIRELASTLECSVIPDVRESRHFNDAAVAGGWSTTLILPRQWRDWNDDERRSVLAHELAHVVRRDALWRIATTSLLAAHFYNPLIHWLVRRVVLYQELCADALASKAIGRRLYLQSLTRLAIRQDEEFAGNVSCDVLPVFSGHLIRRIQVLHSKEGNREMDRQPRRLVSSFGVSAVLFVTGFAVVAARGFAQPPSEASKPATNTIRTVSLTRSISEGRSDPTKEMFDYVPLKSLPIDARNQNGMATVRVRELFQHPQLQPYAPMLNALLSTWFQSEMKSTAAPTIEIQSVEWITIHPEVSFKAENQDHKSQATFGTRAGVIHVGMPVDLKKWINQFAPSSTTRVIEGHEVYALSIAALGPVPVQIWAEDERTIRVSGFGLKEITPSTTLSDLVESSPRKPAEAGEKPIAPMDPPEMDWTAGWNRIDQGLVSMIIAKADLIGLFVDFENKPDFQTETVKAIARSLRSLSSRCRMTAFSLDIAKGTSQLGIRVRLIHTSGDAARQSSQDLQDVIKLAQTEFTKDSQSPTDAQVDKVEAEWIRLYETACQAAMISVEEIDTTAADVVFSTVIPLESIVSFLVLSAKEEGQ